MTFLRSFADRSLRSVKLGIADDHKELRAAAQRVFDATHQHCRVHWMGNALARHQYSYLQAARRGVLRRDRASIEEQPSYITIRDMTKNPAYGTII